MKKLALFLMVFALLACGKLQWGSSSSDVIPALDEFYIVVVHNMSGQYLTGYAVQICFPSKSACYGNDGTSGSPLTNENGEVTIACPYPPSVQNELYVWRPGGPTGTPELVYLDKDAQWEDYGGYHRAEVFVQP